MTPPKPPDAVIADVRAKLQALKSESLDAEDPTPVSATSSDDATATERHDEHDTRSQASTIIDLALDADAVLWHTPSGDPHVTLQIGGHREHHALHTQAFRDFLARLFYLHTRRAPGSSAITDALNTLSGIARFDGEEHEAHVRVAGHDGAVYVDLGGPDWTAVAVTKEGWRVVANPPVRFRRGRALLAMPSPVPGGSVDSLREVVPCDDDDWLLLLAWLTGALRPSGPYPVLALDGEHGSGKSTTARFLRGLIDPSSAALRSEPREIRDLMIAAVGGRVIALDNLSHLQPWLSDALCRISTGGALSTRQLYTNGDEHIIEAVRPTLINGIASVITRGDLLDRAIPITLPSIPEPQRRTEAELLPVYERLRPAALGALLDGVSCALKRQNDIHLSALPRMADFAIWVSAAEPGLGVAEGATLGAYAARCQQAIEQTLEGDAVVVAIRRLPRPWRGTATELLEQITPQPRPSRDWPKSPRGMTAALLRIAPLLRRVGISIDFDREGGTGRRFIEIRDTGARPSPPSTSSPARAFSVDSRDGSRPASRPTVTRPSPDQVTTLAVRDGRDDGDDLPAIPGGTDADDRRCY